MWGTDRDEASTNHQSELHSLEVFWAWNITAGSNMVAKQNKNRLAVCRMVGMWSLCQKGMPLYKRPKVKIRREEKHKGTSCKDTDQKLFIGLLFETLWKAQGKLCDPVAVFPARPEEAHLRREAGRPGHRRTERDGAEEEKQRSRLGAGSLGAPALPFPVLEANRASVFA